MSSKVVTQEQMRAAAYELVKQQYVGQERDLVNELHQYQTKAKKAPEAPPTDNMAGLVIDLTEEPTETEDHPDSPVHSYQINKPIPISSRTPKRENNKCCFIPFWFWCWFLCLLVIVAAVVPVVYFTQTNKNKQTSDNEGWSGFPPFTQDIIDTKPEAPQTKAWEWIQAHPDFHNMPDWRIFQLMALVTLFYNNYWLTAWPPLNIDDHPHECAWWLGSLCNKQGRYIELNLNLYALEGTLPLELSFLTHLVGLALTDNALTGPLPTQLGALTALTFLGLHQNPLTGTLPSQLGELTALTELSLRYNEWTGVIPTQLGELTQVEILDLSSNQLTGTIPTELAQLTAMTHLRLWDNRLTGAIPSEFGTMTQLTSLP